MQRRPGLPSLLALALNLLRSPAALKGAFPIIIAVGLVLLGPVRVDASGITINNLREDAGFFDTLVKGSIGFIPDIHFLVDIPNTPWESSSTIFEAPAPAPLLPDILRVNWTIQHLVGPDPNDIDPNAFGPTDLSLRFIPTVAGPFGSVPIVPGVFSCSPSPGAIFTVTTIAHPLATGGSHFDDFCLAVWGNVSANIFGNLGIDSYNINYVAIHCDQLDPAAFGCASVPPLTPAPGPVPEPSTLVLLGPGALMMACKKLRHTVRAIVRR